MKIVLALCLFPLLATVSRHALAQAFEDPNGDSPRPADTLIDALPTEPRHIALRMTKAEAERAMQGRADQTLSPDIWIYWDFRLPLEPALQKYDSLVVHFSRGRVSKYQLVERKVLLGLLRDIRNTPTPDEPQMLSEVPAEPTAEGRPPALPPRRIAIGMAAADVVRAMRGERDEQLAADLWVYFNFRAWRDRPSTNEALLVQFENGRVSRFRLVRQETIAALVNSPAFRSTAPAANQVQ